MTLRSSNCGISLGQSVGINTDGHGKGMGLQATRRTVALPLASSSPPLDRPRFTRLRQRRQESRALLVSRVEDRAGTVVFEHKPQITRGVSTQAAREVTQILQANVQSGTGTRARLGDQPAAGKTGTTSDFTDAWFVGYTPYLTTAVWMGNASAPVEMRGVGGLSSVTGGTFPAQMWGAFNKDYHQGKPVKEFPAPEAPARGGRDISTTGNSSAQRMRRRAAHDRQCGAVASTGVPPPRRPACASTTADPTRATKFGHDNSGRRITIEREMSLRWPALASRARLATTRELGGSTGPAAELNLAAAARTPAKAIQAGLDERSTRLVEKPAQDDAERSRQATSRTAAVFGTVNRLGVASITSIESLSAVSELEDPLST